MENRTVLAFMAHPDDAEILCAGTLLRLKALGWDVHIATMTAGDLGTMTETTWQISGRRTQEAVLAAAKIPATYHCLDERDLMVVYDKPSIRKTIDLFRRVAPSLVFTHPLADYMMDHEMTAQLCRAGSFIYAGANASHYPLKPGSCIPHLYYCDPLDGIDPLGNAVKPTTYVDISNQIESKTELLACHASQREWLQAHHGMDEYIDAMRRHATLRGGESNVTFAEAFVQHRGHAYPQNDILADKFSSSSSTT